MNFPAVQKLHARRGLSRAAVLSTAAVMVVALLIVARPAVAEYQARRAAVLCDVSLNRALETLVVEYLEHPESVPEDGLLPSQKDGLPYCPSGGDCYLIPQGGSYLIVCGIHDTDAARRAANNARAAWSRLRDWRVLYGKDISITLNGQTAAAVWTAEPPDPLPADSLLYRDTAGELDWFFYSESHEGWVWTPETDWKRTWIP